MPTAKDPRVTIRLSPGELAAWEAERERRHLRSLSELIRDCVGAALRPAEALEPYHPAPSTGGPQKLARARQKVAERDLLDHLTSRGHYAPQAAARFIRIGAVQVNRQQATDPFTRVTDADLVTVGGNVI